MIRSSLTRLSGRLLLCVLLCLGAPVFASAATTAELDADEDYLDDVGPMVPDPLEGWNRAMHSFNDGFIDYAARPAYDAYEFVTPSFFRTGVEMSRFVLNTTAGLGGFIDVAKDHKTIVPVDDDEDFGQTLGVWGVGEGFYIVWPFLGPSTARDSVGMGVDGFLDPIFYVKPVELAAGVAVFRDFNKLDDILDQYDAVNQLAVEPYSSFRNAYIQHRRARLEH